METPNPNPPPPDPHSSEITEEVDRLLDQAEALANEIATQTGVEPAEREATPTGAVGGPEPDPAAAAELANEDLHRVQEIVENPAPKPAADTSVALESEPPKVDEMPVPVIAAPASHPAPDAAAMGAAQSPAKGETVPVSPKAAPRVKSTRIVRPETTADVTAVVDVATQAPKGRRFGGVLKSALSWILVVLLGSASLAWRAFVLLLVQIDRPFTRLSPTAKMNIGLIGAITLAMGLVSFIAPHIGGHNPYADMEPFPRQAEGETPQKSEAPAEQPAAHADPASHH